MFGYLEEFIKNSGINQENGEESCIILDGLDEYKSEDTSSVVYSLLDKVCLPRAMIIVSSRPAAMNIIKNKLITKRLQTFGFKKNEIIEYVRSFPFSSDLESVSSYSSGLEKYLNDHPNVFHMCYLPVHTAMICYLYKHQRDKIPNTQTKIYQEFTLSMILRHLRRYSSDTNLSSLSELTGDFKINFDTLCKLAFTMSVKHVQVITRSELDDLPSYSSSSGDEWCLGLLTVHHTFKSHGEYNEYTFLHLTFQEFLTAYYISRLSKEEQLAEIMTNTKFSNQVWIFLCGLVNFQGNIELFSEIHEHIKLHIKVCLSCAFESQQQVICDQVLKLQNGVLFFVVDHLSAFDFACLNYVTSNSSEQISDLRMSSSDTLTLLQNIHDHHFPNLQTLDLREYFDEDTDFKSFGRILGQCTRLEKMHLHLTKLNNKNAQYICDAFKLINLSYLHIICSSSSEGMSILLSGLIHHCQLQLDLNIEMFSQSGINEVIAGLNSISHVQLSSLRIKNCDICTIDAFAITKAITSFHTTLVKLKFKGNIVDPLFTAIMSSALPHLMCLSELNLSRQNIDDEGVVNISSGMIYLPILEILKLSHNNIGPEGAAAIGEALSSLTELQCLDLSDNAIGPTGAIAIAAGINCCTNLTNIDLSHNNISDDGAAAIGTQLNSLIELERLYLSHNNIGPIGACRLATGLKHSPSLEMLDLSNNNIGCYGAIAIGVQLLHLTKLDQLHISDNNI